MDRAKELRSILAEEYDIHTDEELLEAYKNMDKINIAIFAAPIKGDVSDE